MNKNYVWITGASSGIGEGFARYFASLGYPLILSARDHQKLQQIKAELATSDIILLPFDLESPKEIEQAWEVIQQQKLQVGILVNNAGLSQRSLIADTKIEVVRRLFELNFFAVVDLTKRVVQQMSDRGDGHIISISSLVGKFATPKRAFYSASKHALVAFMDALRAETWTQNIRVTTVCPGYVSTALAFNALIGSGAKQNRQDKGQENGMPVSTFVERTMKKINAGKDEVYVGGREVLGVYLKRFFPSLFNKIIRQIKVT